MTGRSTSLNTGDGVGKTCATEDGNQGPELEHLEATLQL